MPRGRIREGMGGKDEQLGNRISETPSAMA